MDIALISYRLLCDCISERFNIVLFVHTSCELWLRTSGIYPASISYTLAPTHVCHHHCASYACSRRPLIWKNNKQTRATKTTDVFLLLLLTKSQSTANRLASHCSNYPRINLRKVWGLHSILFSRNAEYLLVVIIVFARHVTLADIHKK